MTTPTATRLARINQVWAVTSALTVAAWAVAALRSGGHLTSGRPEAVAVLASAAIKGYLILRQFMEVKDAPGWLRRFSTAWVVALSATILTLYLS